MEELCLDLPAMFADHHVVEVRRILLEVPGVQEVYASSAFKVVEISYDPTQVDSATLEAKLAEAGYTDDIVYPIETGIAAYDQGAIDKGLRHSTAYAKVGTTVSFARQTSYSGRPLWPCPGMGVIKNNIENVD